MVRHFQVAILCTALSLAACGGNPDANDGDDPSAQSDDAVSAASLRPAVKRAFVKEDSIADLPAIANDKLPASVKKAYEKLDKEYGPDYPPYTVTMMAGKTKVIVLADDTDGGSYWEFYTTKGTHITGASQGESGDLHWDE